MLRTKLRWMATRRRGSVLFHEGISRHWSYHGQARCRWWASRRRSRPPSSGRLRSLLRGGLRRPGGHASVRPSTDDGRTPYAYDDVIRIVRARPPHDWNDVIRNVRARRPHDWNGVRIRPYGDCVRERIVERSKRRCAPLFERSAPPFEPSRPNDAPLFEWSRAVRHHRTTGVLRGSTISRSEGGASGM